MYYKFSIFILNSQWDLQHAFMHSEINTQREITLFALLCHNWKITFLTMEALNRNSHHNSTLSFSNIPNMFTKKRGGRETVDINYKLHMQ